MTLAECRDAVICLGKFRQRRACDDSEVIRLAKALTWQHKNALLLLRPTPNDKIQSQRHPYSKLERSVSCSQIVCIASQKKEMPGNEDSVPVAAAQTAHRRELLRAFLLHQTDQC